MNPLRKLFGRRPASSIPATSPPESTDPVHDPDTIPIVDSQGRPFHVPKAEWRDKILLPQLQQAWNHPDQLYALLIQAINDGFAVHLTAAAEQLAAIDPLPDRGATVRALILLEQGQIDDAEAYLRAHIEHHGESSPALVCLAQVHDARHQSAEVQRTLWRALELDPNQHAALGWYTSLYREQEGEAGYLAALQRIAALPGSWRVRLWLARDSLQRRDLPAALTLYQEAIALAPRPFSATALQQLSGDLGQHGHLHELVRLTEPLFQLEEHGLTVGNNLLKAYLELGRVEAAATLLRQLAAQQHPDWQEALAYWHTEIEKARASTPPPAGPAPNAS